MDTWRRDGVNYSDTEYRNWASILSLSAKDWNLSPLPPNVFPIPGPLNETSASQIPPGAFVIQNAGQADVHSRSIESIILGITSFVVLAISLSWVVYHWRSFVQPPARAGQQNEDLLSHEDFSRLLGDYYLCTDTSLELGEKNLAADGVDVDDVERVMALLRQMYGLDQEIWAGLKGIGAGATSVDELKIRSDAVLAEVRRTVASWDVGRRGAGGSGVFGAEVMSPTSRWQPEEREELGTIIGIVSQLGERRY